MHSFDENIATEYGMPAAIILNCLYDDITVPVSIKEMLHFLPYFSDGKLRATLNFLKEKGFITSAQIKENHSGRTQFFFLSSKGKALCKKAYLNSDLKENSNEHYFFNRK